MTINLNLGMKSFLINNYKKYLSQNMTEDIMKYRGHFSFVNDIRYVVSPMSPVKGTNLFLT